MLLRYFYDQKLAQASYFVGCQQTGEAIIIDPGRDVEPYLKTAEEEEMDIVGVTETHIHADFVSGSRELAERTGAVLYLSDCGDKDWKYAFAGDYDHRLLRDGDHFFTGNIRLEVLHTPGHTPEHISFLMTDTSGADRPMGIFTGDFVFVGDVGRPDLLEKAAKITDSADLGARQMFQSLKRFKELPDYLQLWPGHGAGSACGKDLGAVPSSTVGYEKLFNWALNHTQEDAFIEELLEGQPEPPRYFAMMKKVNKEGPTVLHRLSLPEHMPFNRLAEILASESPLVDTRSTDAFSASHIPGTINIPLDNSFPNWAGWILDYEQPFYLIVEQHTLVEVARDLASIGLDNCAGYFEIASIKAWAAAGNELENYINISPSQVAEQVAKGEVTLIDVRDLSEWSEGRIPNAQHIMLGYLAGRSDEVSSGKTVVVQCRTGGRSAIGASILQANGITSVANLAGGIRDWESAGLPVTSEK